MTTTTKAERLARLFHETYERLAPSFGYQTREASAKPWGEVPENNRMLMVAVCAQVQREILAPRPDCEALESPYSSIVIEDENPAIPFQIALEDLATAHGFEVVQKGNSGLVMWPVYTAEGTLTTDYMVQFRRIQ